MVDGLEWARMATGSDLSRVGELWQRAEEQLAVVRGGRQLLGAAVRASGHGGGPGLPPEPEVGEGPLREPSGAGGGLPDDPGQILVVGGIDQEVLGFAEAAIDRVGYDLVASLRAVYVEEGARGVGIGEAMLGVVTAWASEKGCSGVDGYALPGSRSAKAFFEDHGFVTRLLVMHRELGSGVRDDP
ncbi:MAG: GNAT family N-acetyltransferase [Actinomycetota bacterium]|nr:GNAT family N-acetyltransferase [Actinomycetota bacterium]